MDKFIIELHGHKIIVILNINKYHIDWNWSQILLQSPLVPAGLSLTEDIVIHYKGLKCFLYLD